MKTIEQKAKRYDEAIERVNELNYVSDKDSLQHKTVEHIFPELKENYSSELKESERIRKVLVDYFKSYKEQEECGIKTFYGIPTDNIIAWLEKQVEQKPNPYSGTSFEYNGHTWGMCARDNGVEILIDGHLDRVFTIDSNAKEMFIKALERVDEQNAKGYKLTDCDKNSWWEDFKAYTYCTIEQKPVFETKTPEESLGIDSDTYNKIVDECIYGEQKPAAWSKEDEKVLQDIIYNIRLETTKHLPSPLTKGKSETDLYIDWLKSLKNKLQFINQEWSKKDEDKLNRIYEILPKCIDCHPIECKELQDWLKSLRPQSTWKPSDEQIGVIEAVINNRSFQRMHLDSLYEQLKKLREA